MTGTSLLSNQIGSSFGRLVVVWAVLVALALAVLAGFERQRLVGEFTSKSATLHRLASQRADQHDAHLTSLSAIFVAGGTARQDLLLDVAATIMRFYPRITSVNVIPFDPTEIVIQTLRGLSDEDAALVSQMARQSTGALQIGQTPSAPDHYLLVKRSPNTDAARHGLALTINAQALIATDDPFWQMPSVAYSLLTPNGTTLTGAIAAGGAEFSKPLGSASQPLILETSLAIHLPDLLPPGKALSVLAVVSGLFVLAVLGFAQRARTNDAENRARLSAQETRLAHASRVNAMGEMASGMAHELAQPLTAILSQAQAGRHLARRGDVNRLGDILDDTVAQAQRASDILDRLRRWSKPTRAPTMACALNDAVRSVERLLALEAKAVGATVILALSDAPVFIDADPVELEQVIFNLVRNAFDASDAAQVAVRTSVANGTAVLEIIDNGPGVPADLQPRIFEPFVTGKPNGTGLGLALCQRLVDEMEGDIALIQDAPETTFRLSLPLSKMQMVS
jgi:signal transduction histidine kinase